MFAMFIGALFSGYVIGNITSLINNMHQEELEKKAIRDNVKCPLLNGDARLSDLRVDRPRATKSAGMKRSASNPAPAHAGDGAGAAAADGDDCAAPPQIKKARDAPLAQ
jgi:hypothetical protein